MVKVKPDNSCNLQNVVEEQNTKSKQNFTKQTHRSSSQVIQKFMPEGVYLLFKP